MLVPRRVAVYVFFVDDLNVANDDLTLRHPRRRSCLRHHQREHDPRISRLEGCTDFHDFYGE